ncbi:MAG: helix-turn-helix domain-containing protein [Spirochaetia bacterium]|jgi:sugar-specific transcriptional regulator TrmB
MVVNIIEQLLQIGFSEYEARAYLCLLRQNPITAYQAAKYSGLPSSKIYEVLGRLTEKGVVAELSLAGKKQYIPVPPEEFLENYRGKMEKTISLLQQDLPRVKQETDLSYIWNMTHYGDFLGKARRMIAAAEDTLLVSSWKQELEQLQQALNARQERGVKIAVVHFGEAGEPVGRMFYHPIENTIYAEKGGRGFVLVADAGEALMATVLQDGSVQGAWSRNKGFVTLAEDYVKHDIYIMKIVSRFDELLIRRFGSNYHLLRDIFNDEEVKT